MQLITIENKSSVISKRDAHALTWALDVQLMFQYSRSPWVTGGFAPAGRAVLLPEGQPPPPGAWNLILLDDTDQADALGYHDDASGTNIPYSDVFCRTAINDGKDPSAVASHEAIEMLGDPDVYDVRTVLRTSTSELYIVEACDPVEDNDYDVLAPYGMRSGLRVSDFALPAWWELGEGLPPYSYKSSVRHPWEIAPGGYISVLPEGENPNDPQAPWSAIFGERRSQHPAWASRLPRIHPIVRDGRRVG